MRVRFAANFKTAWPDTFFYVVHIYIYICIYKYIRMLRRAENTKKGVSLKKRV